MSDVWTIYKITGNCGRGYVGVTKRGAMVRWKQHIKDAKNGANFVLHRAIRKYGAEWFTIQTLCPKGIWKPPISWTLKAIETKARRRAEKLEIKLFNQYNLFAGAP